MEVMEAKERLPKETKGKAKERDQAWDEVQSVLNKSSVSVKVKLGGLGIPDLKWLNTAMQAQWPWLKKTDPARPWNEFDIQVPKEATQLFQAATYHVIGNGQSTLFWEDRWVEGYRIEELAPTLYGHVSTTIRSARTVQQGLLHGAWALDVTADMSQPTLNEYLMLWERIAGTQLSDEARLDTDEHYEPSQLVHEQGWRWDQRKGHQSLDHLRDVDDMEAPQRHRF
ncbi:putative serine/threonine-protein kinase [Hordeum vulgare]|nr:putative serine/threonine-protein kinase [Hordeum vulgare]